MNDTLILCGGDVEMAALIELIELSTRNGGRLDPLSQQRRLMGNHETPL